MLDVLVIGAGPYGLAAAKALTDRGRRVQVLGTPLGFWRDHMPEGMFLRSGPGWHMDPAGELTFEAFCARPPDPIPLGAFLDYGDWFLRHAGLALADERVTAPEHVGTSRRRSRRGARSRPAPSSRRRASRPSPTGRNGRRTACTRATSSTSRSSRARAC